MVDQYFKLHLSDVSPGSLGRKSSQRSWSWSNSNASIACVKAPVSGRSAAEGDRVRKTPCHNKATKWHNKTKSDTSCLFLVNPSFCPNQQLWRTTTFCLLLDFVFSISHPHSTFNEQQSCTSCMLSIKHWQAWERLHVVVEKHRILYDKSLKVL